MLPVARILACVCVPLIVSPGCKPAEPEVVEPGEPLKQGPPQKREKRISVTVQDVDLATCQYKATETDPPEHVYSCPNLIGVHVVVPGVSPGDDTARAALDRMLTDMQSGGTLEIKDDRDLAFEVAGQSRPATALLIHHPERGDSVGAYTWVEQNGAAHLLFCMAPGQMFFEGRCDPVWDQLLAGP